MKGQYFSFDAIVGASIFILTLVAILSYWYGVSNSIEQQQTVYSKEAIRIADVLYSPSSIPSGLTVNWTDKHILLSKVKTLCSATNAKEVLGSEYGVAVQFSDRVGNVVPEPCIWTSNIPGGVDYSDAHEIYKIRRVGSYFDEDGNTVLGYVDIYVYNPYLAE